MSSFWADPELYELENSDDPHFDLPFWRGLVEELAPGRVLELACGTGRLTLPLAAGGVELVGIDTSEPYLAHARAQLDGQPAHFERADMRSFSLDGAFDLVIAPFNALAYLYAREDQLGCLEAVRAHLAPGGRFAFDLLVPRFDYLAEALHPFPPVRVDVDFEAPAPGIARFLRSCTDRYDAATQTLRSTFFYELHRDDGAIERQVRDLEWHIYFPRELDALLDAAGFTVERRYGSWERAPWGPDSRRYVFVCVAG